MKKPQIVYHKDGSVWAKGDMVDGVCEGVGNGFGKTVRKCAQAISKKVNKLENG